MVEGLLATVGTEPLHHSLRERPPSPSKLGEDFEWPKPFSFKT